MLIAGLGWSAVDHLGRLQFVVKVLPDLSAWLRSAVDFLWAAAAPVWSPFAFQTALIIGGLVWLFRSASRRGLAAPTDKAEERLTEVERRIGPDQMKWVDPPAADYRVRWLLDLHALGTHMLLNRPLWYGHLSSLEQDEETWGQIVIEAIKQCGATSIEISRFTTLQNIQPINSPNAISPEHHALLNRLNRRLTVLREIAERLGAPLR
jgi:hypothetical protein